MRILGFVHTTSGIRASAFCLMANVSKKGHLLMSLNRPLGYLELLGQLMRLKSARAALAFVMTLVARWVFLDMGSVTFRWENLPDALWLDNRVISHEVFGSPFVPHASTLSPDHLIFACKRYRRLFCTIRNGRREISAAGWLLDWTALCCASTIIVDTPDHSRLVPERFQSKAVVVPVGAPDSWFDARSVARMRPPQRNVRPLCFLVCLLRFKVTPTIANALSF